MAINVTSLVLSFCVGLVVMLCLAPAPAIVVKFPRPDTDDREYRSRDGSCFKVRARKVSCATSAPVVPQPLEDPDPDAGEGAVVRRAGVVFKTPWSA